MSDVFRRVIIYKDGSIGVDDERGVEIEGEDVPKWFTREDVKTLRTFRRQMLATSEEWARVGNLADRIEALLPPTEDQ